MMLTQVTVVYKVSLMPTVKGILTLLTTTDIL